MPRTLHADTQLTMAGAMSAIQRVSLTCLPKDMLLRLALLSSKCPSGNWVGQGLGVRILRRAEGREERAPQGFSSEVGSTGLEVSIADWSSPFSITFKLMSPAYLLAGPRETCLVLVSILQSSLWECLRDLRGEERVAAMTGKGPCF